MPAYLLELTTEKCETCGRKATHRLFNGKNAPCGTFCKSCGERRLRIMEKGGDR